MTAWDMVIQKGTLVIPEQGELRADLIIKDGKVAGILSDGSDIAADQIIDASGKYVLPGAIDPHVHIGLYQAAEEEWFPESCAAACGGVTTFLNYHFRKGSYHDSVPGAIALAESQSIVDFGFQLMALTPNHAEEFSQVISEYGITSFKYPMHWKGAEKFRADSDVPIDDGLMYQIMRKLGSLEDETRLCVHSQNVDVSYKPFESANTTHYFDVDQHIPSDSLAMWESVNPPFTEAEPALRIMYYARMTGAQAYLVHISSKETVELAREMNWSSWNTTGETCIHYLGLTRDTDAGLLAKINPPIRGQSDQDALWSALNDDVLQTVGTDHCALSESHKRGKGDFASTQLAFPGMNCYLPVLITKGVIERGISWQRITEIASLNPAKLFRLYPRKGTLVVGSDADVVIVDPSVRKRVSASSLLTGSSDFSVYEGLELAGWPELTIVRGKVVYENGRVCVDAGHGTYLRRD